MTHPAVMVVDGDRDSRRLLEFGLREAAFEVSSAETVRQALDRLQRANLDAIVSEISVAADGDGLDFRDQLLTRKNWAAIPFVFVSGGQSLEQRIRAGALGVSHCLNKPVLLQELVGLLRQLVGPGVAPTDGVPQASNVALLDSLLLLQTSRKSAWVEVEAGGQPGAIYVRDGELIDAELGSRTGSTAFYQLLGLRQGTHEIHFRPVDRPRRIADTLQQLVPRAIDRVECWRALAAGLPDLDTRCTVMLERLKDPLHRLPWQVRSLIELLERGKTLAGVIESSGLDDLDALACLRKLHRAGVILPRREAKAVDAAKSPPVVPDITALPVATEVEEPSESAPAPDRLVRDTVEEATVNFRESIDGLGSGQWIRLAKVVGLVCFTAIATLLLYRIIARPTGPGVAAATANQAPRPTRTAPTPTPTPTPTPKRAVAGVPAAPVDGGPNSRPERSEQAGDEEDYPTLLTRARVIGPFNMTLSKELLQRALEQRPEGWEALQDLALVMLIRGRSAKALSHAQQALKINPDAPNALLVSGVVYQEKGQRRQAARAYRRFVAACPDCRYATDVRRVLRNLPH